MGEALPSASYIQLAGEVVVRAREDLDQRALAGPVFTGEYVHFTRQDLEVDPVQDLHGTERLADPVHHDDGIAMGWIYRTSPAPRRDRLFPGRAHPLSFAPSYSRAD
jgi:hypothetical protein